MDDMLGVTFDDLLEAVQDTGLASGHDEAVEVAEDLWSALIELGCAG